MVIKIRKATKKDIQEILKLVKSNNPKYPFRQIRKEVEDMFSKSLLKPTYLVVEKEGKIIGCGGFIRSWADNAIFNIFWINVLKKYQKKEIGTKLLEEIIRRICETKEEPSAKMITISTNKTRIYKRLGFKKMGKKYDGDYFLMGKIIKRK